MAIRAVGVKNQEVVYELNNDFELVSESTASVYLKWTKATPAAAGSIAQASAIDLDEETITKASHGFVTGLKVQVASSTTLPTGLVALTDYFVIKVDADTFKLAASYADAIADSPVDITNVGAGNLTVTPVALAGTVKLQESVDKVTWTDVTSMSQAITDASGSKLFKPTGLSSTFLRVNWALTGGYIKPVETWLSAK